MELSEIPIAEVSANGEITILRDIYFECTSCNDCCKLNNIPVTEKDIEEIVKNGYELDQIIEEMSPVLIASKNLDNGFVKAYILKKKPFVKDCTFVGQDSLCKIHPFKPLACQLYPFSVRRKGKGFTAILHPDCVCNHIKMDVDEKKSNTLKIVQELLELLSLN